MRGFFNIKTNKTIKGLVGLAVEDLIQANTSNLCYGIGVTELRESLDGGFHNAVGVGRTFGFCQHVPHTDGFEDGTHSTASDNTGTRGSGFHENAGAAVLGFL